MTVADGLTLSELKQRVKGAHRQGDRQDHLAQHPPFQQVVRRPKEEGPEALNDRRHHNPGQKPKLTPEKQKRVLVAFPLGKHREALQGPPPDGGLWTGPKLRAWVERELGKRLSLYPIYRLLHEMGFSLRVPRPQHRKREEEAQVEFKKNSLERRKRPGGRAGG